MVSFFCDPSFVRLGFGTFPGLIPHTGTSFPVPPASSSTPRGSGQIPTPSWSPHSRPCSLVALGSGALTVFGGSTGITSTRSRVWECHVPRDSPAAAFMLCLVSRINSGLCWSWLRPGNWEAPGILFWEVFPLFGGFPLWSGLAGAEGRVKKANFFFFCEIETRAHNLGGFHVFLKCNLNVLSRVRGLL